MEEGTYALDGGQADLVTETWAGWSGVAAECYLREREGRRQGHQVFSRPCTMIG